MPAIWYIVGFAVVSIGFVFVTIGAAWLLSHRNRGDVHKGMPYESGIVPTGDARQRFSVKFYLVAMLFIVFDIEIAFMYPWAVRFRELGAGGFLEMLVFIAVLLVGYVYILRKGALEWR